MPLILLPIVAALVVKFFWLLAAVVGMVLAVALGCFNLTFSGQSRTP